LNVRTSIKALMYASLQVVSILREVLAIHPICD